MRVIRILEKMVIVAAAIMIAMPAFAIKKKEPAIFNRVDKAEMKSWVDSTFATMTQEEKIAQIILLTLEPKTDAATCKLIDKYVGEHGVGALLFSGGSCIEQAKAINYAQSKAKVPLMVTLDGEWGLSMRMPEAPFFPKNMILGAITDERLLYEYGAEVARECKEMGIHVNFAPVLDVNDNPKNPVIGMRSFGEVPESVASHAIAYAKGLEDNGVLSTAKHFPGHGSTSSDSHKTLPVIKKSMPELAICELLPFRYYTMAGLSGVMVGHLDVAAIDASGAPTSLSAKALRLLREDIGFQGLVFTDAMTMSGAKTNGSPVVKAILAGDDVILNPANIDKEIKNVAAAIAKGKVSQKLIDEKCKKMLRYKYALNVHKTQEIAIDGLVKRISSPASAALIRRLWAASMTVIKNKDKAFPVRNLDKKKIAVLSLGDEQGAKSMFIRRCASYAKIDAYSYQAGENFSNVEQKLRDGGYDMVIVGVHSSKSAYSSALATLVKRVKNISLALMVSPYKASGFANSIMHSKAVVMAYDNNDIAQDYAAQTIFGGNPASGRLPVSISGVAKAGSGLSYDAMRLGYSLPEEVEVSSALLTAVDSIANLGLKTKAFTALQVLVARHGKVICNKAYGTNSYSKKANAVDENSIFDLASVTKATGTLAGVMKCYDEGKFSLDDKVSKFLPQLEGTDKEDITMQDILFHETGMPPSMSMYGVVYDKKSYTGRLVRSRKRGDNSIKIYSGAYGNRRAKLRTDILSNRQSEEYSVKIADGLYAKASLTDTIMNRIYATPLYSNKKFRYSCLNFAMLFEAEKQMIGEAYEDYVMKHVFCPLGTSRLGYRASDWADNDEIVATEHDTFLRRQLLQGYVHDEMAAFLDGGVSGNAGLFSNANDLAKLFQMWLNGGEYGGRRYLKQETVDVFLKTKSENSIRGLGFDKPNVDNVSRSHCCAAAPAEVVGHTGYTGTGFWVDPKNDIIYIFLSNRVCPTRNNRAFTKLMARTNIQAAIYENMLDTVG